MMPRRDLLRCALTVAAATWDELRPIYAENISADQSVSWGKVGGSLRLGLRPDSSGEFGGLVVLLRNVRATPLDLYLFDGDVSRVKFIARDSGRRKYDIENRLLYRPCAGLCGWPPTIERLQSGSAVEVRFALDDLLYVPTRGPYSTLASLLQRGHSVQAVFEATEEQFEAGMLPEPDFPWLGRVTSAEFRKRRVI